MVKLRMFKFLFKPVEMMILKKLDKDERKIKELISNSQSTAVMSLAASTLFIKIANNVKIGHLSCRFILSSCHVFQSPQSCNNFLFFGSCFIKYVSFAFYSLWVFFSALHVYLMFSLRYLSLFTSFWTSGLVAVQYVNLLVSMLRFAATWRGGDIA